MPEPSNRSSKNAFHPPPLGRGLPGGDVKFSPKGKTIKFFYFGYVPHQLKLVEMLLKQTVVPFMQSNAMVPD
ncbi:MAG: hypothetical protein RBQ99_01820 [Trichlorobacter sp.]|nr:hypothetical protein [Trichlorobacter sp.]